MSSIDKSGTFRLGDRSVKRLGYGAMQLAGPGVFGPPKDRAQAVAVLRAAIAAGVNHIDTSDFYGPHVTNEIIREVLYPYPADLTIVTKVGGKRGADGSWLKADAPDELRSAIHDNLHNLGLDALDVVNMRFMFDPHHPAEGPVEHQIEALAELQQQGLIRHIGVSHVTSAQIKAARRIVDVVCVQNHYNLAHRDDDALIDELAAEHIAYVPYFPLGGFSPLQSDTLSTVAERLNVTPMQLALAWLLKHSPNILLIPGTSSFAHLTQNLAVADISLDGATLKELDAIGGA
jgi:pyridoxine 4-dehydrogenase